MVNEAERCTPCELATGAGMLLNICFTLAKQKLDCKKLEEDFVHEKITLKQLKDIVKSAVTDKPQAIEELEEIFILATKK